MEEARLRARRSFGSTSLDAEVVAFEVSQPDPAGAVVVPVILDERRAETEEPFDLLLAGAVRRFEVYVQPVLDRSRFGHRDEQHGRALAPGRELGRDEHLGVVVVVDVPAQNLCPEPAQLERFGAVDGDVSQ
jgi:hypothetical protein